MFSHYGYFDKLVEKMLGADYDEHMREAWVWLHGRFVPYPFQNNIHRLPPDVFMDCIMGIIAAQREHLTKANFDSYITAVFGEGIAEHFMRPYNFKVWAHPLEMMGTSWQGDRVPTVDVRRILQNLLDDRDDVSWGPNNKFKFPLLGTGMLYQRIADSLSKPVEFGRNVARVDIDEKVVTFSDDTSTTYDKLINSMPLTELLPLIPQCPDDVRAATRRAPSHRGDVRRHRYRRAVPEHQVLDVLPRIRFALLSRDLLVELLAPDDAAGPITSRSSPRSRSRRTSRRTPMT